MYSNNIVNFQESTILNARTKKSGNLLNVCIYLSQWAASSWVKQQAKMNKANTHKNDEGNLNLVNECEIYVRFRKHSLLLIVFV